MNLVRVSALILSSALLVACGKDTGAGGSSRVNGVPDEQLPIPAGAPGGSVTGMPGAPGPGQVGARVAGDANTVALDADGNPLPVADPLPVDPATLPEPASEDGGYPIAENEPSAEDAVAVVRDYYAAINGRNYAQAFALWSDSGRATGQSPQQFANGFAGTNGVSVELMAPGRVDAAAGSRYVEVPLSLTVTQDDGSQRKYVGMYTLRRAVADGASPEQRAWRIASADLRETQP